MSELETESLRKSRIKPYAAVLAFLWTLIVGGSLAWGYVQLRTVAREMARLEALARFEKDVIFRRWNADLGGVYAPITKSTPSNPYLKDTPDRDITTASGRKLTLINPAYMTRQVHELGLISHGARGHITSLRPIRPQNAPDPWERRALKAFAKGKKEVVAVETIADTPHLRFMRPLMTEKSCLQCHAKQGYKLGQIRGGISVSIPMAPYLAIARGRFVNMAIAHMVLWLLGMVGLGFGALRLRRNERERDLADAAREKIIAELKDALDQIKTLHGIIPICASCKKIRDDDGFWNQVEVYIRAHSEAEFTHSICPDCAEKLYPGLGSDKDDPAPE